MIAYLQSLLEKTAGLSLNERFFMTVLVPDIHDLPTGGNVYNRRMVEAWPRQEAVEVVSWDPASTALPGLDAPDDAAIVVDSLLARHPTPLRTLRDAWPEAALVLLAHYLRCIDPHETESEAAAAERATLDVFDGAVTTSRFTKQALAEEGMPLQRIRVVPPGLDERYRKPRPARSARAAPRMLTVANLLPEKGLQAFVEVLRDLRSLPWTWILVGDASLNHEYAEGVHRRIWEAGLSECVTHIGPVSSTTLRTWYDRTDLFVLPSRFETRSLSMREAMARGLPVVGYRVGGVAENFGSVSAGHLVPPGNAAALRSALRSLLVDPTARASKGRMAWRRSRTFPTWAEAGTRFLSALQALHATGH